MVHWLTVRITLVLLLLVLPRTASAEVSLVAPDGDLVPGRPNRLLVVIHRDGAPVVEALPTVAAERGRVQLAEGKIGDGLYAYTYLAPAEARNHVTFTIGTGSGGIKRVRMPISRLPGPTLEGPARLDVIAGDTREITVSFHGPDLPEPGLVRATVSEGEVLGIERTESSIDLRVSLGSERYPRVALLGLLDERYPDHPPAWVPIRVIGQPRIPVRTEPGAQVELQVGQRSYGPFTADGDGIALASISAWPGEETASVTITDPTGNEQRSTLNLSRENRPLLTSLAAPMRPPSSPMAPLYLAALDAWSQPWTGASPRCSVAPEGGGEIAKQAPGRFVLVPVPPQDESFLDLRVDCELPGTMVSTQARLPMGEGIPDRLLLRVYPSALSADFPVAQVQVLLEDRLGERISAESVVVGAERGMVRMERVEGGALRGEYNGALAAGHGSDRIWARYEREAGEGPVVLLSVGHGVAIQEQGRMVLTLYGRAMDSQGRPLADIDLDLVVRGSVHTATTDARGWAKAKAEIDDPDSLHVLECRYRDRVARAPFLPGGTEPPTQLDHPDLLAEYDLPITAGRVREVFIDTMPAVLHTGPSAVARIRVRLVDRHGNAVTDETIQVIASAGEVGALRTTADATYEAWYRPPRDMQAGTVLLSAEGQEGAVAGSTKLELLPRPLERAVGLSGGVLSNFGAITSPYVDIGVEGRLFEERDWVLLRGSIGYYADRQEFTDDTTGETITVGTSFWPLVLAGTVRHERGLNAFNIGAGLVTLLYRSETHFGERPGTAGMGLGGPGMSLHVGFSHRIGVGELAIEGRYLLTATRQGALGYDGPVGGVAILPGYRVLF